MNYFLLQVAQKIDAGTVGVPTTGGDSVLTNVLNIVYFLAGAVAVIVIIVAGLMYTISGGDAGRITRAKNMILYSVVGLIIVLAAFAITNFVIGKF
ncbi:hypothetical protein KI440_00105 [Candidatus Saccharibacteria bacterium TM7i]|nr:hypothetical protein KI440_00105 [Candidatus Saccharibacteria bacterium TM7i]